MATPVPFRYIRGLPAVAQKEIERNFLHLQGQVLTKGKSFFIACHNASAWETAQADLVLTGTADQTAIQTFIDARPGAATFYFSSGRVEVTGSLAPWPGQKFEGTALGSNLLGSLTEWNCTGASGQYAQGPQFPVAIDYNHGSAGGVGPPATQASDYGASWKYFDFYTRITGATETSVFYVVNLYTGYNYFGYLNLKQEGGGNFWTNFWICGTNSNMPYSMFENISAPATTNWNHLQVHSMVGASAFVNIRGFAVNGLQSDLFFNCIFIGTFYDNVVPVNGNIIWPQSSLPPSGPAGGDLTGTYPNPTIGANKVTNAKLAQAAANTLKGNNTAGLANVADLTTAQVKTLLAYIASGDAAGGDLTGTYPNPTLGTSGVSAGTYGHVGVVPVLVIDAKGRTTTASELTDFSQQFMGMAI